jgi:hypothetical protein
MGNVRKSSIFVISALVAVSAFGQSRTQWRTATDISDGVRGSAIGSVTDVDEGRNRFTLVLDDDPSGRVTVEADAVTTQFNGFGGTINGSPEVYTGTAGFMNLRTGDRVDVRGTGRGRSAITADTITLLGRSVPASATGVGQTRTPDRISPPTARGTTPTTSPDSVGRIEGVVRQINAEDGRMVIETGSRQMLTIRASGSTPVYYRGEIYRISNLEIGDRIRVEPESSATGTGEIRARVIDVLQNVQESQGTGTPGTRQIGNLTGRVTRVDRTANVVRVDTGRGEVRVDLSAAADTQGRRVNATDIQAGDRLDMTGSYSGDVFVASTVRFADDLGSRDTTRSGTSSVITSELGIVTVYATVSQSLAASPQLVVRDTQNDRTLRIYVADDFVVRTKAGTYTTADKLKENDALVIRAYRDADGIYIAQTIRQR